MTPFLRRATRTGAAALGVVRRCHSLSRYGMASAEHALYARRHHARARHERQRAIIVSADTLAADDMKACFANTPLIYTFTRVEAIAGRFLPAIA